MAALLNIPNKDFTLKVGPYTYTVEFQEYSMGEFEVYAAQVSEVEQRLTLSMDQSDDWIEANFLYSVLMMCAISSGIICRIEEETRLTEEDLVTTLSAMFAQVVYSNPKIFHRFNFPSYPFKCQMGHTEYRIKEAKSIDMQGRLCLGITESAKQEISILSRQPQTGKDATFIHELFHVIMELSGLRARLDRPSIQDICHSFSTWILTLMHQNPKVFCEKT